MNSPLRRIAHLTEQFYRWEQRGRGWQIWPEPVDLEPPFEPFWPAGNIPIIDDGRRETLSTFDVDPLSAILAALDGLAEDEIAMVQILAQPTRHPWAEEATRILSLGVDGEAFFIDAPDLAGVAAQKLARPLYSVVLRIAVSASDEERIWQSLRRLGASLGTMHSAEGNRFMPLDNADYPDDDHLADLLGRRSRRSGMLLNIDELVTLVHPPSEAVVAPHLMRLTKKTKAVGNNGRASDLILGTNVHRGISTAVGLSTSQRLRHTYVIGASGTGKSTLLLNMMVQDLLAGGGLALLDPHGDLIEQVLERVPEHRLDDVVLLDAADEAYPVGLNILAARSEAEKTLLASDLVEAFRRLSSTWGDQMTSVLANAILAFLESPRGGTLADLRRFLVEPDYREQHLKTVQDPEIVYYWRKEFGMLTGRPQAPLLTRLDTFLRPKLIRAMVNQKHDRLDFRWMMDHRKIFLAKLTQGAIGEENAYLLGTLLVTKLHQAALGRQNVPEAERIPFFLYIDEFHNFVTPSLSSILSGARKFGLGLVLSHQELRQVAGQNADVASAVIANPLARICFRVGDDDARKLRNGFSFFDEKDLQSLGVGEAIARLERSENDFNLMTPSMPPPLPGPDVRRHRIVERSRARYARRREDVAAEQAVDGVFSTGTGSAQPKKFGPPKRD
jgi:hypothetical protein